MATYKKKGYKPGSKEEKQRAAEENSTTAEVFNTLDQGAGRTEEWVSRNQKYIFIIIGAAALVILGYLGYNQFILEPKQREAAQEMNQAQVYFNAALDAGTAQQDSLFTLALNGGGGKFGFLDIVDNYGNTDAGNLARYYSGMAYFHTGDYQQAIDMLDKFKSKDEILAPLAKGTIGDAFMQLNQPEEALDYYEDAASLRDNNFTTPKFLFKAAMVSLELGKGSDAEKFLSRVKNEYPESAEASEVEVYLGQAQAMN